MRQIDILPRAGFRRREGESTAGEPNVPSIRRLHFSKSVAVFQFLCALPLDLNRWRVLRTFAQGTAPELRDA